MYFNFNKTFGIGARVRLIRQRKYPEYKLLDLVGTVRTDTGSNVSVVFDTVTNTRSAYGCFYFKAFDLVEINESTEDILEETKMNKITNYLNTAIVRFIDGSEPGYHSFANFQVDLASGDLCVVSTEKGQFRLARVADIEDCNDRETYREVIAKVYTDDYDNRITCRETAAELKAKMDARAKQLQDIALYQILAKDDPEMAKLLEEYQGIPKV